MRRVQPPPYVDKPIFETNDMAERTKKVISGNPWGTPWLRLVKRDLLIENNITFDSLIGSNDIGWSYKVFLCSKKFLRVPNICYIRRFHDESNTFRKRTPSGYVHKWMDFSVRALKKMDEFLDGIDFFRNNLNCRYSILNNFLQGGLYHSLRACKDLTEAEVYNIFKEQFGNSLGECDVLVSALYAALHNEKKRVFSTNTPLFYDNFSQNGGW